MLTMDNSLCIATLLPVYPTQIHLLAIGVVWEAGQWGIQMSSLGWEEASRNTLGEGCVDGFP